MLFRSRRNWFRMARTFKNSEPCSELSFELRNWFRIVRISEPGSQGQPCKFVWRVAMLHAAPPAVIGSFSSSELYLFYEQRCIALARNSGAVGSALECRSSGERGDSRTAREFCLSRLRWLPRGRRRGRASVGACIALCALPLRLQLGGLCARRGRNLQPVTLQQRRGSYLICARSHGVCTACCEQPSAAVGSGFA